MPVSNFSGQILRDELRSLALESGVSHFAVADLKPVFEQMPDSFAECGALFTGIALLVPEDDALIDALPRTDNAYRTSHYNKKIRRGLEVADRIVGLLKEAGHQAHRLSHPPKIAPTGLYKAIAHLGGLGWIGKNRLLITPDYGPRVAIAALLTDAKLPPTSQEPMENRCGDCIDCIEICPVRAFSTAPFTLADSLEGFNTRFCAINRGTINPSGWGGCGLCVKVCPFGQGHQGGQG